MGFNLPKKKKKVYIQKCKTYFRFSARDTNCQYGPQYATIYDMLTMLAFVSTNSFHKNKYICWYEKRKWKRKNEEVGDEDWCLIIISSLFLKNQQVLYSAAGFVLLDWHFAPCTTRLLAGTWGDRHQHMLVCAQMLFEGCSVWPWSTASWLVLTDQGQDLGLLLLVLCKLPVKNPCFERQKKPWFFVIRVYKQVTTDKQEVTTEKY